MIIEKHTTVVSEEGVTTEAYVVQSDTGNGTYNVQISENGDVYCNCKSFEFSAWPKTCKHVTRMQERDA